MMYVGISSLLRRWQQALSLPRVRGRRAPSPRRPEPRRLVAVEERGAEEEERREHEVAEEDGGADSGVALRVQQDDEHLAREREDDPEREDRADRVHVVRRRESRATAERGANAE